MNYEHITEWFGLPVETFTEDTVPDYAGIIYRFVNFKEHDIDDIMQFLMLLDKGRSDELETAKSIEIHYFHLGEWDPEKWEALNKRHFSREEALDVIKRAREFVSTPKIVAAVDVFKDFASKPEATQVTAVSLGHGSEDDSSDVPPWMDALISVKDYLPNLRGIFLNDITYEECMISWITLGDISKILTAYPNLEELRVRGQEDLSFTPLQHHKLRKVTLETVGMSALILHNLTLCKFPALEHLELWLGTKRYGMDGTVEDILPFLKDTKLFPKLKHLALCNSDLQNEIAVAAANAPVVAQLESLDLSGGVLEDYSVDALLQGTSIRHLKTLDVQDNFLSFEACQQLEKLGIQVKATNQREPVDYGNTGEEHYYVAVDE